MGISTEIPTVNFATARGVLLAAHAADVPVLLLGDPGVGKSALARQVAKAVGKKLVVLLGSTIDPTDVGGIPFLVDGAARRFPLEVIQLAIKEGVILFLDEISCAPPVVQAALLRLILERCAGDSQLHPQTWVMAAANPPEQAPGGFELSAPLIGRVTLARLRPDAREVLDYFQELGEEDSQLRAEATDFALTAGVQPDLLQINIPADCVTGNAPWGAPRSWERALRAKAAAEETDASRDVVSALLEGSVGKRQAQAYLGILKMRKDCATMEDIVKNPDTAKIPTDPQKQLAILGVIGHVAKENSWAAWIYANRLDRPEFKAACAKMLQKRTPSAMSAKWAKEGVQARVALLGALPRLAR